MRAAIGGLIGLLAVSGAACSDREDGGCDAAEAILTGSHMLQGDEIEQLRCVRIATGDLTLNEVDSVAALEQLTEVHGNLILDDNPALASLSGLERLTRVDGRLAIRKSPQLRSLEGLSALVEVGSHLAIEQLDSLEDLQGLSALRRIGGDLLVQGNPQLTSLAGLESGSKPSPTVAGDFEVSDNDALTSIDFAQSPLDGPYVLGMIRVAYNAALQEIGNIGRPAARTGMCSALEEGVWIYDNPELERVRLTNELWRAPCIAITDSAKLTSVTVSSSGTIGELRLFDLPGLETLDVPFRSTTFYSLSVNKTGLTTLAQTKARVECQLDISNNPALTELGELATSPGAVANYVSVTNNPALPQCGVDALIEQLRDVEFGCVQPDLATVPRTRLVIVSDNDDGAACTTADPS